MLSEIIETSWFESSLKFFLAMKRRFFKLIWVFVKQWFRAASCLRFHRSVSKRTKLSPGHWSFWKALFWTTKLLFPPSEFTLSKWKSQQPFGGWQARSNSKMVIVLFSQTPSWSLYLHFTSQNCENALCCQFKNVWQNPKLPEKRIFALYSF